MKSDDNYFAMSYLAHIRGPGKSFFSWLFGLIFFLTGYMSYGQIGPIPTDVCQGSAEAFTNITPSAPSYTFVWSISASPAGTILYQGTGSADIVWNTSGTATITLQQYSGGTLINTFTKNVTVHPKPTPVITTDTRVGCVGDTTKQQHGEPHKGEKGDEIIVDENGCMKVCEHSIVTYTADGLPGSTFSWTAAGGVIIGYPSFNQVTIQWGSIGSGSIKVEETGSAPTYCKGEKILCVDKIGTPVALAKLSGFPVPPDGECYRICVKQLVQFTDLSIAGAGSPIISWDWDFGDGQHSPLQHPTYSYGSAGTYIVKLKVTNACNCYSEYEFCIDVKDGEAPKIECPSVLCEDQSGHYCIKVPCHVIWTVNGGTVTGTSDNGDMHCVDITWDNVGPSGFGEIIADVSECGLECAQYATAKVPVILQNGTIAGLTKVCPSTRYKYKLPAWPATNFTWSLGTNINATIITSYTTNGYEVEVLTGATPGVFELKCKYENTLVACSGEASLFVNVLGQVDITGPDKACVGSPTTYTLTGTIIGTTTYTLTNLTTNTVLTATGSGSSVTLTFPSAGTWQIGVSNPNICPPPLFTVQVLDAPAAPTQITGETIICPGTPYVYEGLPVIPGTIFRWVASGGTPATGYGSAFTTTWGSGGGTLTVTREYPDLSGCPSAPLTITVSSMLPITSNINGQAQPCQDAIEAYTATYGTGDYYEWSINDPSLGSVISGQYTSAATVQWNHLPPGSPSVTATLTCKITKCDVVHTFTKTITIVGTPVFTITATPNPVCAGDPVTLTATPSFGTVTSPVWNFGDGTPNGSSNPVNHTYSNNSNAVTTFIVGFTGTVNGCPQTGTTSIPVDVYPAPFVGFSPDVSTVVMCFASSPPPSSTLTVSASAGSSIVWSWSGGTPPPPGTTSYVINSPTQMGTYSVTATNSYGCTSTDVITYFEDCTPGCTPVGPAGINGPSSQVNTSCDNGLYTGSVTMNGILGSCPGNILSVTWSEIYPNLTIVPPIAPSCPSGSTSTCYVEATKPGVYPVFLNVAYQNSIPGDPPCVMSKPHDLVVPVIANFHTQIQCNGTNNGYNITSTDNSDLLGGMTITQHRWQLDGGAIINTGTTGNNTWTSVSSGTHTIWHEVTVSGTAGGITITGYTCTRTYTNVTIPTLPSANFTYTTTLSPTSTCEGREVTFTASSYSSTSSYLWNFGDTGGGALTDATSALAPVTQRVYTVGSATSYVITPTLTVTDQYGCTSSASIPTITVFDNKLAASGYVLPMDYKCVGDVSPITVNVTGGSPTTYLWHNDQNPAATFPSAGTINVTQSGTYWVEMTNALNCKFKFNPPTAKRVFYPLPDAVISGKHDVCFEDEFTLDANTGPIPNFTYVWKRNSIIVGTDPAYTETTPLPPGTYTYTVEISQVNTPPGTLTCTSISQPFLVTVHALPAPPSVWFNMLDCASYSVELNANSATSPVTYNWSNGMSGTPVVVNMGGAYRCWLTDQYGCSSYSDMYVPENPAIYFWRFPTGCYDFCPEDLPRHVDGPDFVTFNYWEWQINTGGLPYPNGPYASSGSGQVQPLWINQSPPFGGNGNGSGSYTWLLDNGLCKKISDPMDITIEEECCRIRLERASIKCIDNMLNYNIQGYLPNPYGVPVNYNIFVLEVGSPSSAGTATPGSGVIPAGGAPIMFSTHLNSPYTQIRVVIEMSYYDADGNLRKCIAEAILDVPQDCQDPVHCDIPMEKPSIICLDNNLNYHFDSYVGNPFGVPFTYSISVLDPGSPTVIGSCTPSTGSIGVGGGPLSFDFNLFAPNTSVRFLMVVQYYINGQLYICTFEFKMEIPECHDPEECDIKIKDPKVTCLDKYLTYHLDSYIDNPFGVPYTYSISVVDPVTYAVIGICTPNTGTVNIGGDPLSFNFSLSAPYTTVMFEMYIQYYLNGQLHVCKFRFKVDVPECGDPDPCDIEVKKPKVICLDKYLNYHLDTYFGNPFGSPYSYTISVVDAFNNPIGICMPSSGVIGTGGGLVSFNFHLNTPATIVKFIVIVQYYKDCKPYICKLEFEVKLPEGCKDPQPCKEIDIKDPVVICIDKNLNYHLDSYIGNPYGFPLNYSILPVDGFNNPVGTCSPSSGVIAPGTNPFSFDFHLTLPLSSVRFIMYVWYIGEDGKVYTCEIEFKVKVPKECGEPDKCDLYPQKPSLKCDKGLYHYHFYAPTMSNPYGAPAYYSVSLLDVTTNAVIGTSSPNAGVLPAGGGPVDFDVYLFGAYAQVKIVVYLWIYDGDKIKICKSEIVIKVPDCCDQKNIKEIVGRNLKSDNDFMKIFPNPAGSNLALEYQLASRNNTCIYIYNVLGAVVYKQDITGTDNRGLININTDKLTNGLYNVQLRNNDQIIFNNKLVIQH